MESVEVSRLSKKIRKRLQHFCTWIWSMKPEPDQHLLLRWPAVGLFGRGMTCRPWEEGKPPSGSSLKGMNGATAADGKCSVTTLSMPRDRASASMFFFPGMCAILTSTRCWTILVITAWKRSLTFDDGLCERKRSHTLEESEHTSILCAPLSIPMMIPCEAAASSAQNMSRDGSGRDVWNPSAEFGSQIPNPEGHASVVHTKSASAMCHTHESNMRLPSDRSS